MPANYPLRPESRDECPRALTGRMQSRFGGKVRQPGGGGEGKKIKRRRIGLVRVSERDFGVRKDRTTI